MKESRRKRYEQAVAFYRANESVSQIAARLGVSSPTVRAYLEEAEKNGEIELRPEDARRRRKTPRTSTKRTTEDPQARATTTEPKPADSTFFDRLAKLESTVAELVSVPKTAEEALNRTDGLLKSIEVLEERVERLADLVQTVGSLENRIVNLAVKSVEHTEQLKQLKASDEDLTRLLADIQEELSGLSHDRRTMAGALLDLLNDLRHHYHVNDGRPVLPSTVPLPAYSRNIARIRDREVMSNGQARSHNGTADGVYPEAVGSTAR